MDRNFARALQLVLRSEGGWSDQAADPGGATMRGVTLATYRRYINPNGSKEDLRNITDAQLADVYRKEYWDAVAGDDLPDGVDYAVFDFAVNSGPSRAAHYLQSVVGATIDGAIGPETLAAVTKMPAGVVIDRLCDARLAFLQSLSTWHAFGIGWSARVASVRKNALLMTAQPVPSEVGIPTTPQPPQPSSPAPAAPIPAPSAPPKSPDAPVPAKPPVPKAVQVGMGLLIIASSVQLWWGDIVAWLHSHLPSIF